MNNIFFMPQQYKKFMENIKRKSRRNRITNSTLFNIWQQAFKLKFVRDF